MALGKRRHRRRLKFSRRVIDVTSDVVLRHTACIMYYGVYVALCPVTSVILTADCQCALAEVCAVSYWVHPSRSVAI